MKQLLITFFALTLSLTSYSQNIVIIGGDATEAFASVPSDHTVGNPCGVPNFMNIFVNGNYTLPGNLYIQDAILTINGELDYNGFTVTYLCENSELIIANETLSVPESSINTDDIRIYPNPSTGIFYVNTDKPYSVNVYNMAGQFVTDKPDIRHVPNGIYLIQIIIDDIKITKKLIKK